MIPTNGMDQFGSLGQAPSPVSNPNPNASVSPSVSDPLADNHAQALAQWKKINTAYKLTEHVVRALGKLKDMGDIIDPEDVVDSTAELVGHGAMTAKEAASGLSDMPTEPGQTLASWVSNHNETFQAHLAQLKQANAIATHQLGVSALHVLAKNHVQNSSPTINPIANGPLTPGVH